jgi:hypothetical protein
MASFVMRGETPAESVASPTGYGLPQSSNFPFAQGLFIEGKPFNRDAQFKTFKAGAICCAIVGLG